MASRVYGVASAAVLAGVMVVMGACSCGGGGAATENTPSGGPQPSASATADQHAAASAWHWQASTLSQVLFELASSAIAWTSEPTGDFRPDCYARGPIVLAKVRLDSLKRRTIAFDCVQFYVGDRAMREARRDGYAELPGPDYIRNAHVHEQVLPLAARCAVAQFTEEDAFAPGPLTAITPEEFCRRLRRERKFSRYPRLCWLVIDGHKIVAVLEELRN